MIVYNNQSGLTEVYLGTRDIAEVYIGDNKVFPTVTPPTGTKFQATYIDGTAYEFGCNGDPVLKASDFSEHSASLRTITNIDIYDCVTSIEQDLFFDSTLSGVTLPATLENIGDNSFAQCNYLKSVTIPSSVISIGRNAFYYDIRLMDINIPDGVTSIAPSTFALCESLSSCTISDNSSLTSIGSSAFTNCSSLLSLNIPSGITTFGKSCFENCSGMTNISIPFGTSTIPQAMLKGCKSLTSVTVPSTVIELGAESFKDCTGLQYIEFKSVQVPQIGAYQTFDNTNNCPIYVPCESVEDYRTSWVGLRDRITCHYEPQYRTITSTTCINTDKWQQDEYQVSTDGGETWTTTGTSATTLLEANSYDCGYRTRTITSTTCIGVDKWQQDEYQVSTDAGETWTTTGTSATTLIESQSYDCGYRTRQTSGSSYCNGYDKYIDVYDQVSEDYGESWTTTATTPTLVEADSEDCGYVPPVSNNKFEATYNDGTTYSEECDSDSILRTGTTQNGGYAKYSGMTSAVVGDCITTLGTSAFAYCRSLTSVTIPDSVTKIYGGAFKYCYNLTSVGVKGSGASVEIPSGITSFSSGGEFEGCSGLTSVTIGSQITEIGYGTFSDCSSLTDITIPSGVNIINGFAFANCTSLTSVTVNATVPPSSKGATSNWKAFNNTNNCPIYVPSESVNAYKSANGWSSYADRIRSISEKP